MFKMKKLVIRLTSKGRLKKSFFSIVVTFSDKSQKGFYLDIIGYIDPFSTQNYLSLNGNKFGYWLNKGAFMNKDLKAYLVGLVSLK